MRLSGRNVLITGSSQGIGQEIAYRLAQEGADIVINYRGKPDAADRSVAKIRDLGRKSLAIAADITSVSEVQRLVREAVEGLGSLDTLINNAGVEKATVFWEITEKDYDLVLSTNLKGAFFASQAFVQHLLEVKKPGRIINISSVHEELPFLTSRLIVPARAE